MTKVAKRSTHLSFLQLAVSRHCAYFKLGPETRRSAYYTREPAVFCIAATARLAKQIEKTRTEAPSSFMHCMMPSNELRNKIYNERIE